MMFEERDGLLYAGETRADGGPPDTPTTILHQQDVVRLLAAIDAGQLRDLRYFAKHRKLPPPIEVRGRLGDVLQVVFPTRPGFCEIWYAQPQADGTWKILNEEGDQLGGDDYLVAVKAIADFKEQARAQQNQLTFREWASAFQRRHQDLL